MLDGAQLVQPGLPRAARLPRLRPRASTRCTGEPHRVPRPQRDARRTRRRCTARGSAACTGRFHDNCGALMTQRRRSRPARRAEVSLPARPDATTLEEARALVGALPRARRGRRRARRACARSGTSCSARVQVATPDAALDVHGQRRGCSTRRSPAAIWGRTALYQSSGAFGFRDQLQDVAGAAARAPRHRARADRRGVAPPVPRGRRAALVAAGLRPRRAHAHHRRPPLARRTWPPSTSTRPATPRVLDEMTPYLEGPPLAAGARGPLPRSPATLAARRRPCTSTARRARVAAAASGAHGLPLMGGGDWNDGMNRVGHRGHGRERVARVVPRRRAAAGSRRLRARGATPSAPRSTARAPPTLVAAVERERAGTARGTGARTSTTARRSARATPRSAASTRSRRLGGHLGRGRPRPRATRALEAVEEKLVRWEDGLDRAAHAAVRPHGRTTPATSRATCPACARTAGSTRTRRCGSCSRTRCSGDGDEAARAARPASTRSTTRSTREAVERYKVEPYVVAADVYAVDPHVGRGGWTWYTGSASWFYRVAIRWLLGIDIVAEGDRRYLVVDPCIPKAWPGLLDALPLRRDHLRDPRSRTRAA